MSTFVIVHGAWGSHAEMEPVVEPLESAGHAVITVDLPCVDAGAIRANVTDLERAIGRPFTTILVMGGATRSRFFTRVVADVLGRPVRVPKASYPTARGCAGLVTGSPDPGRKPPGAEATTIEPQATDDYEEPYGRFIAASAAASAGS